MWVTNKYWYWDVVVIVLVASITFQGLLCYGCSSHERTALLQLKSHFPSSVAFSSWGRDADCCTWDGVICNPITSRVSQLRLSGDFYQYGLSYLNASLFLPFGELTILDLSHNYIAGCVENGGFETLSKLENLESLDLSVNNFNNSILSSLSGLSLKKLDLRKNLIKGSINMTELNALSDLKELDLSENEIIKFESFKDGANNLSILYLDGLVNNVADEFLESLDAFHNLKALFLSGNKLRGAMFRHQSFPHLKNLEQLDLSNYTLNDKIVQSISNLTSLQYLNLKNCGLSGYIIDRLCALKDLQKLDMSDNYLIGTLAPCMENFTSLEQLDLSWNNLNGDIFFSPLKSLTSLESLILSNNHFQIPISFSPFFNHSKLKSFDASKNEVYSRTEMQNLIPNFQLQSLLLSCYGNGESFPQFLYHQHGLYKFDISHVRMRGRFPYWLLQNNTNLKFLNLKNTSLSKILELPIQSHMNLSSLDISSNKLSGQIPSKIGACFLGLVFLNMSNNNFSGSIPSSMGNMSLFDSLDLSNNKLSGKLPDLLIKGCQEFTILKLSNNKLQGQMFPGNASLIYLAWLQLDNNQFTGSIPHSLSKSSALVVLDVSHNNLLGGIPQWITTMTYLDVLDLSYNKLDGILLPNVFPPYMSEVYLSNNRLQGSLLNEFDCTEMVVIDLNQNNLIGGIPKWLGKCSYLQYLLLMGNNFEGEIPKELCKLDMLSLVDLSSNHLCGHIPSCLRISVHNTFVDRVESARPTKPIRFDFMTKSIYTYEGKILSCFSGLDLSDNNLIGVIPFEIGNFDTIQVLNLSHNNLVGRIPASFSNLQKVESLDLSNNKLEGNIPPQLTQLHCLSFFSVAFNNLSGRIPDLVTQFATFETNSYEGNPLLCGSPLSRSCDAILTSNNPVNREEKEEDGFIDMNAFYISFGVSSIMMLLGMFVVLCINPSWRRAWFYFVGRIMNNCFYLIVDNIPMLSKYKLYKPFT